MNVIKVNFDNAYIKKPIKLVPGVVIYRYNELINGVVVKVLRIVILPRLNEEPLYDNFFFDIYLNDVLVSRINKNSYNDNGNYIIEYRDRSLFITEFLIVKISGEYSNVLGNVQEVKDFTKKIYTNPLASSDLVCSEITYVSDYINGTYIYGFYNDDNGKFYFDRTAKIDNLGELIYEYSGEYNTQILGDSLNGKIFVDVPTLNQYEWNSINETFVLKSS